MAAEDVAPFAVERPVTGPLREPIGYLIPCDTRVSAHVAQGDVRVSTRGAQRGIRALQSSDDLLVASARVPHTLGSVDRIEAVDTKLDEPPARGNMGRGIQTGLDCN